MQKRVVEIWVDGSGSGWGFIVKLDRQILVSESIVAKPETTNVAEYTALIAALEWAKENVNTKLYKIIVFSDSQLIVRQVNNVWPCLAEHLQPMQTWARSLMEELKAEVFWISGKENREADGLSRGRDLLFS